MAKTGTPTELGTQPIGKLLLQYAIPAIIAMTASSLYNMVDSIFIGHGVGPLAISGLAITFPLMNLAAAFGSLVGVGASTLVSVKLGQKDYATAQNILGNVVTLNFIIGIGFSILTLLFLDPILYFFGASPDTISYARDYMVIILLGNVITHMYLGLNALLRASGHPQKAMTATITTVIINTILDPIFIFVFEWGMMGAAVATVIGQVVTAILAVWYLYHMRLVKPKKADFSIDWKVSKKTLILGVTSFLSQISLVAAMAAINNMIRKYGAMDPIFGQEQYAQIPMAVVGIVMKFFQIVISIVVGMAAGCIPIVGYNMGAGLKGRVKELFTKLLLAEASVGAVALIIVEFFPGQLITIFGAANESVYYTEFALKAFRIYLCMMIFACVNKACFIFLQAMGKAAASTALSMIREIVFGVGFALVLPIFFGLDGVLYSMPVSDLLTFLIALYLIRGTYKELTVKEVKVNE